MTERTVPAVPLASPPEATRLWLALIPLAWIGVAWWAVDQIAGLLMHFWLLKSLHLESVFWTNFRIGAALFLVALLADLVIIAPAYLSRVSADWRRIAWNVALLEGVVAGAVLARYYPKFLTLMHGQPFGEVDPVFGHDIGFYVFDLPALWVIVVLLWYTTLMAALSGAAMAWVGRDRDAPPSDRPRLVQFIATVATPYTTGAIMLNGWMGAVAMYLGRFDLLFKFNKDSSIYTGASYVDVTGVFSYLTDFYVTAAAILIGGGFLVVALNRMHQGRPSAHLWKIVGVVLVADFLFKGAVAVRQEVFVTPNEPVIQLPFIDRHIQATRAAFALDTVEKITFIPKDVGDPLPDPDEVLAHPAMKNAPLWPGFVSYLEELIDLQHTERILKTGGDPMVYGPTLEIFRQQQKLRAYYDFMDVDTIRLDVDGEPRMFVSAVREIPLMEPKPWLSWWGQRYLLFTHGYGIVTASASEVTGEGEPVYYASGIPVVSEVPGLDVPNQAIYYGEGAGSMTYTNVREMKELDYPTDEGRAEVVMAPDADAGVPLDSLLKRLVFGWRSGQFVEIVFSSLIASDTRVHYYRTPLERVRHVVPFLYLDSDPYAVASDGHLVWTVNAISWTDRYPYSAYQDLGDKSDERSPLPQKKQTANYARDAVKATVNAYTGQVAFYQVSDDPIVETWSAIYPGLFSPLDEMPTALREQMQYPGHLFHVQFDDLFVIYQMEDPMTFYNMEDMWDDGDEVLGPVIDSGHSIRFSIEPFNVVLQTGDGLLPLADPPIQFASALVFTPEAALNLRAIPIVYQDGPSYGKVMSLQVPKGHFFMSPEQADALIDQDPFISQQITWWNRMGADVIRGHTSTLLVDGEVFYVEPIFLRSQQNPVTQLKRVVVVFRGKAGMGKTLDEAVRLAIGAHTPAPVSPPPSAVDAAHHDLSDE